MGNAGVSRGLAAAVACVWEATARKPGNVHPAAAFADCSYLDFVLSAAAAGFAPASSNASNQRAASTSAVSTVA